MKNSVLKKKGISYIFLTFFLFSAMAQNPIIKNQFTADPTARVFEGKMYLYTSHDIPSPIERLEEWFCMEDYHVFSSDNLVDWQDHGVIVSQDNVPWVAPESYSMWAPDCVYKEGKYYFYFPSTPGGEVMRGFGIGVATSDTPYGPFTPEENPIEGVSGIDPCVLIDSDGESYLYWSGRGMSVAKLKDNMLELDSEPIQIEGLPEGFKEGPFVFKRNDTYYYTFPWVREETETLAYATGDNPMGPFKFQGIIMEESPSGCWTNHHSIVEYNDQWYLFYHHNDYSPDFDKNRSVRIDSLFFNPDGTIQQVIPTLRGVGNTTANEKIHLDRYTAISSTGASIDYVNMENLFDGWKLIFNEKDAWSTYNNVDFGKTKHNMITARILSKAGGTLHISINDVDSGNSIISELNVPSNSNWQEVEVPLNIAPEGVNNIQVSLVNEGDMEIDWITFK